MEYVRLNEKMVSRIGFGCCPLGMHGWGNVQEDELKKAVNMAVERGINIFDTADIYGLGKSEFLLGKALGVNRNRVQIGTKFGVKRDEKGVTIIDNSPKWIEKAISLSLKRLKTDYIDIYQLHYWDGVTPLTIICEELEKLKEKGMILSYGATNLDLMNTKGIDMRMWTTFSFEYSLAQRKYEDIIVKNLSSSSSVFLSWGSLGQGVLSGKYSNLDLLDENDRRRRDVYTNFHGEKYLQNIMLLKQLDKIFFKRKNVTKVQIAIWWILKKFERSIALVGIKNDTQLLDAINTFSWRINKREFENISKYVYRV